MPNKKKNISFKKKNKRGGRGVSSIGVNVTPIHEISNIKVYRASSKNGNKNTFYKVNNNGRTIHVTTENEVKRLQEEENKAAKTIQTGLQGLKKRMQQKQEEEEINKKIQEAAETFYKEIYKKINSNEFTSKHGAITALINFFEITPVNNDNNINSYETRLKSYQEKIKEKYIKDYKENGYLHKEGADGITKKINEALQEAEKKLAATKIQALARGFKQRKAEKAQKPDLELIRDSFKNEEVLLGILVADDNTNEKLIEELKKYKSQYKKIKEIKPYGNNIINQIINKNTVDDLTPEKLKHIIKNSEKVTELKNKYEIQYALLEYYKENIQNPKNPFNEFLHTIFINNNGVKEYFLNDYPKFKKLIENNNTKLYKSFEKQQTNGQVKPLNYNEELIKNSVTNKFELNKDEDTTFHKLRREVGNVVKLLNKPTILKKSKDIYKHIVKNNETCKKIIEELDESKKKQMKLKLNREELEKLKTQYALLEYLRKEIYGKPKNGNPSSLRHLEKLEKFIKSDYVKENLLNKYPDFNKTLTEIAENNSHNFNSMNRNSRGYLTTEGSDTPYRKIFTQVRETLKGSGEDIENIYDEKKQEIEESQINNDDITVGLENNNNSNNNNSQQISDEEEGKLEKYLIDQNKGLLYNYLNQKVLNDSYKKPLIDFLEIKKDIDGKITSARIIKEGGLYILAKKLLTKGKQGKEILKKYYPENYNPYNESQLGGSRKPTKKQNRKGKLPKHLRNTRRRKSYHKKRQLKTKNTRTRKFKK